MLPLLSLRPAATSTKQSKPSNTPSQLLEIPQDAFERILSFLSSDPEEDYYDILQSVLDLCTSTNNAVSAMCDASHIYARLCERFGLAAPGRLQTFAAKLGKPTSFTCKEAILVLATALHAQGNVDDFEKTMFQNATDNELDTAAGKYIYYIEVEDDYSTLPLLAYINTVFDHGGFDFPGFTYLQNALGDSLGGHFMDEEIELHLTRLFLRLGASLDQPYQTEYNHLFDQQPMRERLRLAAEMFPERYASVYEEFRDYGIAAANA